MLTSVSGSNLPRLCETLCQFILSCDFVTLCEKNKSHRNANYNGMQLDVHGPQRIGKYRWTFCMSCSMLNIFPCFLPVRWKLLQIARRSESLWNLDLLMLALRSIRISRTMQTKSYLTRWHAEQLSQRKGELFSCITCNPACMCSAGFHSAIFLHRCRPLKQQNCAFVYYSIVRPKYERMWDKTRAEAERLQTRPSWSKKLANTFGHFKLSWAWNQRSCGY